MRAEITEKGCLVITAETAVESFALKMWAEEYYKKEECTVTLLINTTCETTEG